MRHNETLHFVLLNLWFFNNTDIAANTIRVHQSRAVNISTIFSYQIKVEKD